MSDFYEQMFGKPEAAEDGMKKLLELWVESQIFNMQAVEEDLKNMANGIRIGKPVHTSARIESLQIRLDQLKAAGSLTEFKTGGNRG